MNLLDLLISPAAAQATGAAAQPSPWQLPIMLGVFFLIFWLFIIRPQSKRQKEHRAMLGSLSKGDEVVTSGGLAGRVDDVGDAFIVVEVADNVKVKVQKHAIAAVLPKGTLKAA